MNDTIPVEAVSTRSGLNPRAVLQRLSWLKNAVADRRERQNAAVERELGIDTRVQRAGAITRDAEFKDSVHYEAVDYPLLRRFIGRLNAGPSDVAFEIGCGAGRMLCELARLPIAKAVGVELSPELAALAAENARTLKGPHAPIEVIAGDATKADYSEGTIYALFNPFGEETMKVVLERIERSLEARPRAIQILYINPVCGRLFDAAPWLRSAGRERSLWYKTEANLYTGGA